MAGISKVFLAQAREELARDDLLQASEKLWGAAAHMVKAVAQRRGWPDPPEADHRSLVQAVDRLVDETNDVELTTLFGVAQALHGNFYNNFLTRPSIDRMAGQVEEFVSRLDRLN